MNKRSSEQQLSSLEHSQNPPVELLDEITNILKISWKDIGKSASICQTSAADHQSLKVREQWVLRWLIKRLGQSVGYHDRQGKKQSKVTDTQQDHSLISGKGTWLLLRHLLSSVPVAKLQEILVDRKFCQIFNAVLECILQNPEESQLFDTESAQPSLISDENGPPLKRRRLSEDDAGFESNLSRSPGSTLARELLRVAKLLEKVLRGEGGGRTTYVWTENPSNASALVGNITQLTYLTLKRAAELVTEVDGTDLEIIDGWLNLWSKYISSDSSTSKQDPHNNCNSFILIPALNILSVSAELPRLEGIRALESRIATHTLLPARSAMKVQATASRSFQNSILRDRDIELLVREVRNSFQPAADEFATSKGVMYASLLLAIASRLIPRSDVVRRKSETHWFEMLFLCLVELIYSTNKGPDLQSSQIIPITTVAESDVEQLLDAFIAVDVLPSVFVWHYFNKRYVVAERIKPSYNLLRKTVKLNAAVFVDDFAAGYTNLAGELYARIPFSLSDEGGDSKPIVVDILCTLMHEYGKTAQFPKFIELWKSKIAETFYDRATAVSRSPDQQPRYVWDDPDLLEAFTAACRQYAPLALCKEMLKQAENGLQSLPTIVGPTHQIFTQLTIAMQVLKTGVAYFPVQTVMPGHFQTLVDYVCLALARSTDYQGHRWRLYKFLTTVVQADPTVKWLQCYNAPKIVKVLTQNLSDNSETHSMPQSRALLLERFYYIDFLATNIETDHTDVRNLLEDAVKMITWQLESLLKKTESSNNQTLPWDGTVDGIGSLDIYLSACTTRISALLGDLLFGLDSYETLLVTLIKVVLYIPSPKEEGESCLVNSTDHMISLSIAASPKKALAIILQTLINRGEQRIQRIPTFLGNLVDRKGQGQVDALIDLLLEHVENLSTGDRSLSDSLTVLSDVATNMPDYFFDKSRFKALFSGLQKIKTDTDLIAFVLTTRGIERLVTAMMEEPKSSEAVADWRKFVLSVCKFFRKETKTFQSSSDQRLFDTYAGFLLSSVLTYPCSHQLRKDEEINDVFRKIETRVRKQIFDESLNVLEDTPSLMLIMKISKMLHFLFSSFSDDPVSVEERISIQKLEEKIIASITEVSSQSRDYLEVLFLKKTTAEMNKLISTYPSISSSAPTATFHAKSNALRTKRGELEAQAVLAFDTPDPRFTNNYASVIALIAAGARDVFSTGQLDETKLLFTVAITAKGIDSDTLSKSPDIVRAFGQIANLESALQSWDPTSLILRLELGQLIFNTHPTIINQHIIDTTLSNVALLACSASKLTLDLKKRPDDPHPQHIFDRLCQVIIIILTRHRRRLTGRHHLLLAALQNLLKCLFYPPTRQHITTNANSNTAASKAQFLSSLPHWLNPPSYTSPHTLPVASAVKLSRILQILCDPSTSSARRVSKRNRNSSATMTDQQDLNLVDETRLLRRQVSQHTQYLLQTYCQAVLDGWISPEVKEKLTLGLYAICNATDVEVMRGMNSAMNESQRAIWKDLYADWMRWGKWNQQ